MTRPFHNPSLPAFRRPFSFFLLSVALSSAFLYSCYDEPCRECREILGMRHVELSLGETRIATRALDVPSLSESNVMRCDLFVFDRSGALVEKCLSTDGRFDFFLTDGIYDFVAVANKGDLPSGQITRGGLLSLPSTLGENTLGAFVMAGSLDNHEILGDEKITVEVQRLVAKVTCTVRTDFTGYLSEQRLRIDSIYLTNVPGLCTLAGGPSRDSSDIRWFNRLDSEPSEDWPSDLLFGAVGREMGPRDSLSAGLAFYTFPNSAPDSRGRDAWTPRCTRLVVAATLCGKRTFYPVTLEKVERNRHYMVDLTVSNFGTEHPEDLPDKYSEAVLKLTVEGWGTGGDLEGIY